MNIIDHLSVGVTDIGSGCDFYDGLMGALDCARLATTESFAAYGNGSVQFLLMVPLDGSVHSAGNGAHICFVASSPEAVDHFHQYGVGNGGICEGQPGPRPGYPKPGVYTAFLRDPFGNKLEAIYNGFAV